MNEITLIGTVKFFDIPKGYGFITVENDKDYFFHVKDLRDIRVVQKDDKVSFVLGENRQGTCAISVKQID